jgi:hypothetical protein
MEAKAMPWPIFSRRPSVDGLRNDLGAYVMILSLMADARQGASEVPPRGLDWRNASLNLD